MGINDTDAASPQSEAEKSDAELNQKIAEITKQFEGKDTKRPEIIPEKFWDAEKGEVRVDAMAKSYTEMEKMIGNRQKQPADSTDSAYDLTEITKAGIAADAPELVAAMEWAKEHKIDQKGFEQLASSVLSSRSSDQAAEVEKLGLNANQQIETATRIVEDLPIPSEQKQTMRQLLATADGIRAINAMHKNLTSDPIPPRVDSEPASAESEILALVQSKEYNSNDPADARIVQAKFDALREKFNQ